MARTIAPSDPAAPIAESPATPAPHTSTFAGGTFPAAVTWPVKNRPNSCAASITARYPAMLAIELNTSNDCAREIRGTASIDNAVIGRFAEHVDDLGLQPRRQQRDQRRTRASSGRARPRPGR